MVGGSDKPPGRAQSEPTSGDAKRDLVARILKGNLHDLAGANLAGANLAGANLVGADLTGANLAGADLAAANLMVARLAHANLERANLAGANLAFANLAGARLEGAKLGSAIYSEETIFAEDFVPEDHGMLRVPHDPASINDNAMSEHEPKAETKESLLARPATIGLVLVFVAPIYALGIPWAFNTSTQLAALTENTKHLSEKVGDLTSRLNQSAQKIDDLKDVIQRQNLLIVEISAAVKQRGAIARDPKP